MLQGLALSCVYLGQLRTVCYWVQERPQTVYNSRNLCVLSRAQSLRGHL
jgi:hypothetical protein